MPSGSIGGGGRTRSALTDNDHDTHIDIPGLERHDEIGAMCAAATWPARWARGARLYLVKPVVELHRGTLSVNSVEGRGSGFGVRLPRLEA